jgi:hypothetical protein
LKNVRRFGKNGIFMGEISGNCSHSPPIFNERSRVSIILEGGGVNNYKFGIKNHETLYLYGLWGK